MMKSVLKDAPLCHSESRRFSAERKNLELRRDNRFLALLGMTFTSICTLLLVTFVAISFVLPQQLMAQPASSKSMIKVVLLRGGASGLSAGETESFYSSLQEKLSQFPALSISLKGDLARGLNKADWAALEKCSDVACIQPLAGKAGFQRILLCKVTKKNAAYQFQSYEYDVKKTQALSEITDNAVCESAGDVDNFVRKVAMRVGQSVTHDASVPESLQESSSNLWWYVGAAATVGVAAGVYFIVSHKKQNSTAPSSLPLPPNFP